MASTEIKTEEIEKAVSVIIKKTFEKLVDIYSSHKEHHDEEIKSDYKSRLIFPCYGKHRNNNLRRSLFRFQCQNKNLFRLTPA